MTNQGRHLIDQAGNGPPGLNRITPDIAKLVGEAILHDFAWVGRGGVQVHCNRNGITVVGIDSISSTKYTPDHCHDAHSRILWDGDFDDAFALIDFMLEDDSEEVSRAEQEMEPIVKSGSPHGRTR